jgi:ATP-dependent RNA helicase DeaD
MKKFENLGLSTGVLRVLEEKGFQEPTEIQEKAIPLALKGKDIIGGSSTGSGKTLAFASSILENVESNGTIQALIMTPTRELSEQVTNSIAEFGSYKDLNVLAVYGGVGIEQQIKKLKNCDVLVGTPGRILDHLSRNTLDLSKVKILVLDEVDRMFDMGFSKDVEEIISNCPKKRQTMLFSATISPELDYLSKKHTNKAIEISVQSYVDPKKLKQVYYDVEHHLKFSLLVHLLKRESADLVMVFCATRRNVDFVYKNLNSNGIEAHAIHGGLNQNQRNKVLEGFHTKGVKVLICTDVAARGLDISGVSHVYNYDLPAFADDYVHRIGRTARAGKEGIAISLVSSMDYENFYKIERIEDVNVKKLETPYIKRLEVKIERKPFRKNSRQRDSSRGRNRSFGNKKGGRKFQGKKRQGKKGFRSKR